MKLFISALLGFLCGFCLAACVVVEKDDFEDVDPDDATLVESVKLGNNILASFRDEDFGRLKKNIPGPLQTKMTEKDFQTSCANWRDSLGRIKDFDYVLELDTPAVRNLIWRVEFERDAANGKEVEQDMLFRLVTGKVDDETCVLSCGFL
ncbi:MAG: hypothetical protein IJT68_08350 [Lentisphaeria bacterium]|nr:hypothetical protein [Lentisphaeria bacterium]